MLTVGIHNSGITSSCAIIRNGKILFASCEERYSRNKFDKYFPIKSLESGLKYCKLNINDIDNFAVAWNPGENLQLKFRPGFSEWPAYQGARLYSTPNKLLPLMDRSSTQLHTNVEFIFDDKTIKKFQYINHHDSHAAFTFFASGFKNADILINDGYGEIASSSSYTANFPNFSRISQDNFPNSLGMLYATITQFLGFSPNFDEWKVMGAAAYGNPKRYEKQLRKLISFQNGKIELDLSFFKFYNFDQNLYYSEKLCGLLGANRDHEEILTQRHYDIASSLQAITEEVVFSQIKYLQKFTKNKNLCLSGGVAMNCLLNGYLSTKDIYKNIYIPHSPDDSGNAIGAALLSQKKFSKSFDITNLNNPYLGKSYSNSEIHEILNKFKINAFQSKSIEKDTAAIISQGKIIGWFQGEMEFGQRALGNRSILADPRNPLMKKKINDAIKYREGFRPFAPSVLEEDAAKWFDIGTTKSIPFMEKIFYIKPSLKGQVPSIAHEDGSARLQTVTKINNPRYFKLLQEFKKLTGIPMLLNTSFNVNNEPIVESPTNAIRTFYTSGLDALVIGDFIIVK